MTTTRQRAVHLPGVAFVPAGAVLVRLHIGLIIAGEAATIPERRVAG